MNKWVKQEMNKTIFVIHINWLGKREREREKRKWEYVR